MPLAASDVHVCTIDDGAPRAVLAARQPARVRIGPAGVWLVMLLCEHCNERTGRYCTDHNHLNWWLTSWGNR
jgi:hypothetical protein